MNEKTMKVGAFATKYGVSDRHARRLVAEHEADLIGHIEKRGNAGTWIDEYAEAYLRDLLRNPLEILPAEEPEAVPEELQAEVKRWMERYADLALRLADAEQRAARGDVAVAQLEAAEQRTLLLQDVHAESIGRLEAEHRANVARLEDFNRALQTDVGDLKREIEGKDAELCTAKEQAEQATQAQKAAEDKLEGIRAKLKVAKWWQRKKILRELEDLQRKK